MGTILIVDDSETLRMELKSVLQSGGHQVIEAVDGLDGVKKAETNDGISLILADYNMPGLDGITMISKIKGISRYANVPVGILTTESSKDLKAAGKDAGVIVWFVKPFDGERLLQAVDKILERFSG
jgi:two-component system chemotaxis response regulator CheY